jgi:hypothetical protein
MTIKSSIEKLAETIGYEIGTSDDITQGNLLNAFFRGMDASMPKESDVDMQLCYLADKLGKRTERLIFRLNEFIEAKNRD